MTSHKLRCRLKWVTTASTNIGILLMGLSFLSPAIRLEAMVGQNWIGFALSLVFLALAGYISPLGEAK